VIVGAVPVPVRATGEPTTGTFAVMVAVPVALPAAVGEKTTTMVQVDAGLRVAPQVPPPAPATLENGAVTTTLMPVTARVPVLDSVSVCCPLVVVTGTLPNATEVGVTAATAAAASWISTAPGEIRFSPASRRGLPKKSVAGASAKVGDVDGMVSTIDEDAASA
jgi:hypothetical protein